MQLSKCCWTGWHSFSLPPCSFHPHLLFINWFVMFQGNTPLINLPTSVKVTAVQIAPNTSSGLLWDGGKKVQQGNFLPTASPNLLCHLLLDNLYFKPLNSQISSRKCFVEDRCFWAGVCWLPAGGQSICCSFRKVHFLFFSETQLLNFTCVASRLHSFYLLKVGRREALWRKINTQVLLWASASHSKDQGYRNWNPV